MSFLAIDRLTMRFQGLVALNSVCFDVKADEIFSVIGPNGAGKTTVFNAVTGIYEPTEGCVRFCGMVTERVLSPRQYALFALIGTCVGLGTMVALNVQGIWDAAISQNYVYQEPFPWRKSVSDFFAYLNGEPYTWTLWPFLLAFAIGAAGAFSVWSQSKRRPDVVSRLSIARTFQNIRLFRQLTALENVLVGMDRFYTYNAWHAALRLPRFFRDEKAAAARARELLEFVELGAHADICAGALSYGHQRRLEIARALAAKPKLILLDEPAAGMNPTEAHELVDLIRKIRDTGVAVVLIEHHMRVVMAISDRIAVLDFGNKIAEGTPEEVRSDPRVIEAYLGPQV